MNRVRQIGIGDDSVSHKMERAFMSRGADAVFGNLFNEYKRNKEVPVKIQAHMVHFVLLHVFEFGIPDPNGLVPVYLHLTNSDGRLGEEFAAAFAKPRMISIINGHTCVTWGITVVARLELDFILNQPDDERDTRLMSMIGANREDSEWWTKPTIEVYD